MFEPAEVEANTSVTVSLTLDLPAGANEVVVPVPDAFTIFACTAPAGWTCWTTSLGTIPASMTLARSGGDGQSVTVTMDLRTPTAGGEYAFGDDVLVVTGGFEGGPSGEEEAADDPVVGEAIADTIVDAPPAMDTGDDEVAPSIVAALLLLVVSLAAYRAARRRLS